MTYTRRSVTLGMIATALASCAASGVGPVTAQEAILPTAPNAGYDTWVASFRGRALANGITATTFDAAFQSAGFLPGVVERDRNQIESRRTFEDLLAIATSPDRVATGRRELAQRTSLMSEIEAHFGVPAPVFTAIWGMETNYGRRRGNIPTISALSTLAYDGRRGDFYRSQLMAALRILQNGDVSPTNMTGSWAGAMGHTQFIPTSYEAYAVDFNGDGRRDVWSDDPTDGLASAASYLANAGWRRNQPWGLEVKLPADFNTSLAGAGTTRSPGEWAGNGITDMAENPPPNAGSASILLPAGPDAPAFMVFRNYRVILRYNNSVSYGVGVGHLSDRLAGGPPIQGSFGVDANGLNLSERITIQTRLTARGYDTQGVDGVTGNNTRTAIEAYERAEGLPVTGTPSRALLGRLQ